MRNRIVIGVITTLVVLACCVPDSWTGAGPIRVTLIAASLVVALVAIGDSSEKAHNDRLIGKHHRPGS